MNRIVQFVGMLPLVFGPLLHAQQAREGGQAAPQRAGRPPRGQGAPRIANPDNVVLRLMQMTPAQRERALARVPPERREQILKRLQQFDSLPQAERDRRLRLGEMFASLPPDRQELVRRQIRAFNQLPPGRRRVVGAAFQRLRRLPEDQRQAVLARPRFRQRFSPDEQQILQDLSGNLPPAAAEAVQP